MSSLNPDEDQKWVPTHVQVTVMKGRGLRGKGKNGTSDVYTIIQLGKEKYSTCVVEKTTEPEWREECTFELQPGALESSELVLTVMHRALIGLDVFLGQAVIPLGRVFTGSRGVKNEWYRLNSKTGKKEKERGDIQVTVQFTRNNLTASMYDLVMKDKSVSTFFKLKERIKGKRRSSEEDSSSAILPGGYGSLVRMRQRLPSDGGGEEYYEDDEGGEVRRSKMRTFFLRGKLRKSSDTRSSTSLGSESSESSSRGGSLSPTAGISVVVSDLSNSPSNSSNLTADNSPEHTANTSPKLSSPKCEFGDEAGEITIVVPQPKVCVNGSHSLSVQPLDSGKPAVSLGLGLLKPLPLSMSLQNLSPQDRDLPPGIMGDGRRWSFDKPDEEEKAAIAAALEQSGPMLGDTEEESLGSRTTSSCTVETDSQGKKQKRNLFSQSRSDSTGKGSQSKDESELAPGPTEDKHRGWFGSKDSHSKPSHSLVVSPTADPDTDPHPHPFTWGCTVDSPLHYTNPFSPSQPSPPPLSRSNPFFTTLHNPFYKDMFNTQPLNPSLPPLPFLSSARPPITTLFPEVDINMTSNTEDSNDLAASSQTMVEHDALFNKQKPLSKKFSNPFTSEQELDSEWDRSFDEFAAGRLQSPEDLTTDCKTQQNTTCGHPPTHSINKETVPLKTDTGQTTNDSLCSQSMVNFTCIDSKDTSTHHFFTTFLDTIPENSLEHDNKLFSESPQTPNPNTDVFNDSNCEISSQKFNSISPDPTSSGLGSSAEEDGLSCFSSCSASDKLSSSEETEVQNFESSILGFEKPPVVKHLKASESEEEFTDKSEDISLDQQTVIEDYGRKAVSSSPTVDLMPPVTEIKGRDSEKSNCYTDSNPQLDIGVSNAPENKLSPSLPSNPVFVITSSPGLLVSPFESTNVADQDQLSPVPVALFTDIPNTSSISPSPDASLTHTNASDRSSFAQSLYVSADSQEYQTCLSHATSGHSEISANSTLCVEHNSVQMANDTAMDLDNSFNTRRKDEEIKPAGQTGGVFGDVNAATFETNFTEVDSFYSQRPKQEVVVDDMFSNHLNGGLLFEQNGVQMATDTDDFFKTSQNLNDKIKPAGPNGGLFGDFSQASFETNFTAVDDFNLQSGTNTKQEEVVEDVFSKHPNGGLFGEFSQASFETNFTAVDDFNLQSGPHTKQEVVVEDVFSKHPNGGLLGDVTAAKFESNFTAPGDFILQSGLISPPKQEVVVEDVFSKNPNGGFFDDWAGAKIESDFTAADSFSLQSSKQEVIPDDVFSKHLNTELFGDMYKATFVSNFTTMDDFNLQSAPHTKQDVDNVFAKRLQAEHAILQRSQSEGALTPAFDELQASAFGSDPGSIQESASCFKPQPDLLLFSPFSPSLTPQCSSSPLALCPPPPVAEAATPGSPTCPAPALAKSQDTQQQQQQQQAANQHDSPHPVKPLTTAMSAEEKRTESRSVLEKLKSTITPGRSSQSAEDSDKKKSLTEGAGSYYHLTHSELVALLVQREAELARQKAEFERQKTLLAKRETELKKLKPQVRDLEDYIDTLLVRIMEQKPTLLQVRSKFK